MLVVGVICTCTHNVPSYVIVGVVRCRVKETDIQQHCRYDDKCSNGVSTPAQETHTQYVYTQHSRTWGCVKACRQNNVSVHRVIPHVGACTHVKSMQQQS